MARTNWLYLSGIFLRVIKMSIEYMSKAFKMRVGGGTRKLILLKLADNAGDDGRCFPSYQNIADYCEVSRRSAMRHVAQLVDDGYLEIEHRTTDKGNSSNIFKLILPSDNLSPPSDTDDTTLVTPVTPPLVTPVSPRTTTSLTTNETIKKVPKKFSSPSEEEVDAHAADKQLNSNGFFDYYESNGWKVGKNTMKNWKAALSGWSKRQYGSNNNGTRSGQAAFGKTESAATRAHNRNKSAYQAAVSREQGAENLRDNAGEVQAQVDFRSGR